MSSTHNLEQMFQSLGINLPNNIRQDVDRVLKRTEYINKHFCFLIDLKTNQIICYDTNIYFKSNSFPFSMHAEIQTIVKYYRSAKTLNKNKKALVVVKLTQTGTVGNSKCCLNCSTFLKNNFDALKLKKIYFSIMKSNKLEEMTKNDLYDQTFRRSKGFMSRLKC